MAKKTKARVLEITLVKSTIGYSQRHKATVKALGLRRMNQTVTQTDSPALQGMLRKINNLVRVEEKVEE